MRMPTWVLGPTVSDEVGCWRGCRDMSVEDAIELGRRAIYHATFRDSASGGTASGTPLRPAAASWGVVGV
jgi:hypothetical protein